ncbi:hypothetical protein QTP70_033997 [Hemibagrus guttatus]|uniref:Ig-like domain-containing protein n=1 Tax=Hemibagrus guttatus TaxID=175788 RepID=A0AAE0UPN8_9TELE|nr:hypothetical protein QTP70_033997 [Hemibagrus guttatus]
MTSMKITGISLMVCLLVMHSHTFPDISAIVDGPVSLPCNCSGDKVEWTIFSPIKASIAECHHGVCEIKPPFNKSFSFLGNTSSGNFSISINSTRYNDLGMYRCTCNGKQVSGGKLHVYDPRIVTGVEGNITSLPCYGDTRLDAKDVQWKKDGKDLLEYTRAKPNETSAGRFSVSKQGFQDGDLSLHISSVNLSDAGFYLCLIHDESREGDPRAVVLKVKKHQPEHQPPTTPNCYIKYLVVALVLGLVSLIVIGAIVYSRIKDCKKPEEDTPTSPVQEESQMIPKYSSTQIIQD